MTSRTKILNIFIIGFLICLGVALILYGASNTITFFYKPAEIDFRLIGQKNIRLGGFVKKGSIKYMDINLLSFILTDYKADVIVKYKGIVPKLFRDEQGIVVKGKFEGEEFIASEVLAKHDENYTPDFIKERD